MKKLLATAALVAGLTGALGAMAPSASAQLACIDLYVRIGENVLVPNTEVCIPPA